MQRVRSMWSLSRAMIAAGLMAGLMAAPFAQSTAQTKAGKGSKTGESARDDQGRSASQSGGLIQGGAAEEALPTVSKSDARPVKLAKVDPQTAERTRLAAAKIDSLVEANTRSIGSSRIR